MNTSNLINQILENTSLSQEEQAILIAMRDKLENAASIPMAEIWSRPDDQMLPELSEPNIIQRLQRLPTELLPLIVIYALRYGRVKT